MVKEANENPLAKLLKYLDRLEKGKLTYRLEHWRESICVEIAVPGERWEVEFFEDGHIEFERFLSSDSGVEFIDEDALYQLVEKHTDTDADFEE